MPAVGRLSAPAPAPRAPHQRKRARKRPPERERAGGLSERMDESSAQVCLKAYSNSSAVSVSTTSSHMSSNME